MASKPVHILILPPCPSFDAPDAAALPAACEELVTIWESMVQLRAPADEKLDDAGMVVISEVLVSEPAAYHTPALVAAAC